jgi:outer membrane protein
MKRAFLLAVAAVLSIAGPARAEPLSLREAREIALRNHPRVTIAQLRERVAQEVLNENKAAYLPTADAYADGVEAGNRNTRILAGGLNNPVIYDRVADGIGVSELITDFGQTSNRVAAARLETRAASEETAAVTEQILLNVDLSYFAALQARAVLGVARETVSSRRLLADRVAALARNQLRSDLDVSFAQVALEDSLLILQKAEGDVAGTQASLAAALGYPGTRAFDLQDEPLPAGAPPDVESLIARAEEGRPDTLRLRYERDASERLTRAQRDRNYPTIAAVGTAGNAMSHDTRLPDKYAAGGITVDFPLFAGGATLARQREAELNARIADQSLRDQQETVSRDVRLAWINLGTAIERLRTTERLVAYANQAYSLADARYRLGSSSIVELSEAQLAATSARIAGAQARYEELMRHSILDYQTGSLGAGPPPDGTQPPLKFSMAH